MAKRSLYPLGLSLLMPAICLLLGCGIGSSPAPKLKPAPHWQVARLSESRGGMLGEWYCDMSFVGPQHGWITNGGGSLLHTQDGGATWVAQDAEGLWLDFVNEQVGWIVHFVVEPDRSLVGGTRDGGATWTWSEVPGRQVRLVAAVSENEAWLAATANAHQEPPEGATQGIPNPVNGLLHTTDGGKTWNQVAYLGRARPGFEVMAIRFLDRSHGWVVGGNPPVVLRTQDGGNTFAESELPVSAGYRPSGSVHCSFPTAQEGWLTVGEPHLLHTTDGGRTWQVVTLKVDGQPQKMSLHDCSFPTQQRGWVIGWGGAALCTEDGGRTWTRVETGTEGVPDCDLRRVIFTDEHHGWVLGEGGESPSDFPINTPGSRISFILKYVP